MSYNYFPESDANGQQTYEKMAKMTHHQEDTEQNPKHIFTSHLLSWLLLKEKLKVNGLFLYTVHVYVTVAGLIMKPTDQYLDKVGKIGSYRSRKQGSHSNTLEQR